jgi:hypothetical protein
MFLLQQAGKRLTDIPIPDQRYSQVLRVAADFSYYLA